MNIDFRKYMDASNEIERLCMGIPIELFASGRSFTKDEAQGYHSSLIALSTPTGRKIEI